MNKPLLSIIMPVYNVLDYLNRSLQSILTQSFQDFELIIIDDGSTDGSMGLVGNYAHQDSRIRVFHQANAGVSAARNTALGLYEGRYLTFVDPDDFIAQDTYLENIRFLLANSDVDILQYPYCNYIDDVQDKDIHHVGSQMIIGGQQIFSSWWSGSPLEYVIWNKIYRREMWNGVTFNVGHISEDTGLAATFCQRASKVYISEKGMYYYQRNRADSYTYHYSFDKHIDLFNAHFAIFQLFKKYPSMTTEKVLAFTRLLRRLIQAKQECPTADVYIQHRQLSDIFPSIHEIIHSVNTEKLWLCSAKILGVKLFMKLFLLYLKR